MKAFMTSDFFASEIILCGEVRQGTPVHKNRPSHGLVFYPEASSVFTFDDGTVVKSAKDSVIYLPMGSNYIVRSVPERATGCYVINFRTCGPLSCAPFSVNVRNAAYFRDAFENADKCFRTAKNGYMMKCRSILCDIISNLQYEYGLGYVSGKKKAVISPALELIHETYTESVPSVSELSGLCGVSATYFRKVFGDLYGTSPLKYITGLKISRAKELLSSEMYSIGEVALMCGYEDAAYFSREFKKCCGISPRGYLGQLKFNK